MVRRIQVGAVVGRQLHQLYRPAFAIWQIFFLESREERSDLFKRVLVREIFDFWRECWGVAEHVVFKKDR